MERRSSPRLITAGLNQPTIAIETHETPDCANVVFRELYDMKNDPDETTNLADDPKHKDTLRMMAKRLREGRASVA